MLKRTFKILTLLTLAFSIQACTEPLPAEEKCNFVVNSSGRRVSWANLPVTVYVDSDMESQTYRAIKEAAEVWNDKFQELLNKDAIHILGRTNELPQPGESGAPPKDGYNGIYVIDNGAGFSEGEQARTALHYKGDNIHEADIVINGTLRFFSGLEATPSDAARVELVSLLIHEFGHSLGLDHIEADEEGNDVNSVMESRLAFGEARRELKEPELKALLCEY